MKKTLLIIAGSALLTSVAIKAAPAFAEPIPADLNVSIVRTADLDLSSKAGQRTLEHRLVIAAGEVCGEASDADLKGQNDARKCRHDVLAKARADANAVVAAKADATIVVASRK